MSHPFPGKAPPIGKRKTHPCRQTIQSSVLVPHHSGKHGGNRFAGHIIAIRQSFHSRFARRRGLLSACVRCVVRDEHPCPVVRKQRTGGGLLQHGNDRARLE